MRVVIDTDVLLSGLRSSSGASRILLIAVLEIAVTPLVSTPMLLEYEAVLKRPNNLAACKLHEKDIDDLLDFWASRAEHISRRSIRPIAIMDPNDAMFADAALAGLADALVTFNMKDYRMSGVGQLALKIVRSGELLSRMTWRPKLTLPFAFRRP